MGFLRALTRNLPAKIVAVVAAVLIWFAAVLERNQTASIDLPVTIGKVPPGMLVTSTDTNCARTQLTGKGRDLLLLQLRKPVFRLNPADDEPGRARMKLGQEQSTLPATVQLISVKPEYVVVNLDQQARRAVKVTVPTRGKPARGFVVTSVKSVDNVYVSGPEEEIGLVTAVSTESLSVAGLTEPDRRRLRIVPPTGGNFRAEPESVQVAIKVEPEESRVFADVTVNVFKPASRAVVLSPGRVQVTVSGAAEPVRGLELQDILATMKITDTVPRGKYQLPCEITLPPGISLVKCEPPLFDLEVK